MSKKDIVPGTLAFPFVQGRAMIIQDGPRSGTKLVKLKFNATIQRWLVDVEGDIANARPTRGLVCFLDNWTPDIKPNAICVSKVLNSGSACSGTALTLSEAELAQAYLNNKLETSHG